MQSKVKVTTAAILISVFGMSSNASAAEVSLQYVIDSVVAKAVSVTAHEISRNVYSAVANAGHQFDINQNEYNTKVLISKVENLQKEKQEKAE